MLSATEGPSISPLVSVCQSNYKRTAKPSIAAPATPMPTTSTCEAAPALAAAEAADAVARLADALAADDALDTRLEAAAVMEFNRLDPDAVAEANWDEYADTALARDDDAAGLDAIELRALAAEERADWYEDTVRREETAPRPEVAALKRELRSCAEAVAAVAAMRIGVNRMLDYTSS